MTTALYLRISDDPRNTELGIGRQRELCEDVARRRGWLDVATYVDNDVSATKGKHRPGYEAMMAAVDRGEVSRVVCYQLSRVWRNRRERADGIERMRRGEVTIACARGPELDLSTAYGRAIAEVAGAFDTMESEVKSERELDENAQHARRGLPPRGRVLYGYRADGESLAKVEREAARVKGWFGALLAGASVASLARDAGVTPAAMRFRLKSPTYAGLRVREGVEYPGIWPAIVDPDVWRAAVTLLDGRLTGPRNAQRLLSSLAACKRCGVTVVASGYRKDGRHVPTYKCERCARSWRRLDVDTYVDALVRERLGRPDARAMLAPPGRERGELLDEAAKLRAGLRVLAGNAFSGIEGVAEQADAARARLRRIETELLGAEADPLWQLLDADDPVAAYAALVKLGDTPRLQAIIRRLMTVTLDAPPRGRKRADLDDDQLIAAYALACIVVDWNQPS
jgi:Site-specific recombinases, DNA invertase Pin homologs